jgi:hypothetical protein
MESVSLILEFQSNDAPLTIFIAGSGKTKLVYVQSQLPIRSAVELDQVYHHSSNRKYHEPICFPYCIFLLRTK